MLSEYARALTKDKKFKEALSVISLCSQVYNWHDDDTNNDTDDIFWMTSLTLIMIIHIDTMRITQIA